MSRVKIAKGMAKLSDVITCQDRTYIEVTSHQRRTVQHRREPADDDELDLSVAQSLK